VTPPSENSGIREALERIRVMEASKFWRLRNIWHRGKKLFGLSNGPIPAFGLPSGSLAPSQPDTGYTAWFERHSPRHLDLERMRVASQAIAQRPLLSIVMATFDTPEPYLIAAIDSVFAQAYENWELCVADDASRKGSVRRILRDYAARDARVKVTFRPKNGHISRATNSALELATGAFVIFLDHDDVLAPDALYEIALLLNDRPDVDVIYSDEDKIDDSGQVRDPHFKPDWCPESFLSRMYVGHLTAYRRTILRDVGGMRPQFDGSQDYDLLLRVSERTDRIHHIPRVLYHWRMHDNSTASRSSAKPYAEDAAERALNEALERRGERGKIEALPDCPGTYAVHFAIRALKRVSIIIPTRDHGDDVERCIRSALARTSYPDLEIIVLDNGSTEPASLATFDAITRREPRVRVVRHDVPFNFSAINNFAVAQATGEYFLFLNNDTEARSDRWIEAMVEQAQREPIGAVGALLLYPDNSVQHAGVILGLGGVAGHSHKYYPADAPGYYYMLKSLNNYSAVTAACLMVRRDAFEAVGGFDESLAIAFNDVDFCLRLRAAGYRNVVVPGAVLYHFESKSRGLETTPEKIERFASEIAKMKARWPLLAEPDPCYNPNLTLDREDFSIGV
jgi:O-antigen biosynthesis protein